MGKYQSYYDCLNLGKKDYDSDIRLISNTCHEFSIIHNKILEIGCGTGNHTKRLCAIAEHVSSCDIDPDMLSIARSKLAGCAVSLYSDIALVEGTHDLAVMMWNVMNYIPTLKEATYVFSNVFDRLRDGGLFVFDMWNGVAVIRDLPKSVDNEIRTEDGKIIRHSLIGRTSLLDLKTCITNKIRVYQHDDIVDEFEKDIFHYIWTTNIVCELLRDCGFEIIRIAKHDNYVSEATENDWKVVIIARRT